MQYLETKSLKIYNYLRFNHLPILRTLLQKLFTMSEKVGESGKM